MKSIIFLTLYILLIDQINSSSKPNMDEIKKNGNSENGRWKEYSNLFYNIPLSHWRAWTNTSLDYEHYPEKKDFLKDIVDIPDEFKASDKWPHCKHVINHIRNQGQCSSGWAVASASTFNDYLCIEKKITNVTISADDVLACSSHGNCKKSGYIRSAWLLMQIRGVASGGDYNSKKGCIPYSIPPSNIKYKTIMSAKTPSCMDRCTNANHNEGFTKDRYKVNGYMKLRGEKNIQKAIFKVGSVTSQMKVYKDFFDYTSGVYKHDNSTYNSYLGVHAIKIIGWGIENLNPYWLCANSWGTSWGEEGFCKILRGSNEVGIEDVAFGVTY